MGDSLPLQFEIFRRINSPGHSECVQAVAGLTRDMCPSIAQWFETRNDSSYDDERASKSGGLVLDPVAHLPPPSVSNIRF